MVWWGENGAGKSTLVKLLAGLYQPTSGRILYDGKELSTYRLSDWQQRIGFIFQNFLRYEATAAENILYGDWQRLEQASDSDRQIRDIASDAGVADLVSSLPEGYNTRLGLIFCDEQLSDGQWQQLAIARAFARKDSQLLILDEPSSGLDVRAEYELFCRFRSLAKGRTTILISHRFSTLRMADRILVLQKGHMLESGSHDDLLARGGLYAQLYALGTTEIADE